jgi:hypothetical protein
MTAFICISNIFAAREINNASVFVSEYNSAGAPEEIFNINSNFSLQEGTFLGLPAKDYKMLLKHMTG